MLAPIRHILPLTMIRRERMLPTPGRVVARKGQKVSATDVIAEARLNPDHLLLDIALGLGLPEDQADKQLQCKTGQQVAEGDLLAGPVGLTKRVMRAPRNGRVVLAGGGQVLMELDSSPQELRAGMPGVVTDLLGERGVVIETTGALIQGVWGNGRIDYGLLSVLIRSPEEVLTADRMDVSMRGSVILGGHCADIEILKSAANLPVRGLILASMEAKLIPFAARMHYPIIVIEGFGPIAMNSVAYKLLTTNDRREVALNAEAWDRYTGARPEILIELPAPGELPLPQDAERYAPGQTVRVVRAPSNGIIGKIVKLSSGLITLANGVKAQAAEIQLESNEKVVIPLVNLEIMK